MTNLKTAVKLGLVAILTVGVFGAGLFGFNRLHLSATTSGTLNLPPLESASALQNSAIPADFVPPGLNIIARASIHGDMPTHYIDANGAALLAAQYIWEVYGICLDGRAVSVIQGALYASHRTYWRIIVYSEVRAAAHEVSEKLYALGISPQNDWELYIERSRQELMHIMGNPVLEHQDPFSVTIDAITGERLSISNMGYQHPPRCLTLSEPEIMEAMLRRAQAISDGRADPMDTLSITAQQLENFSAWALEYAVRHHGNPHVMERLQVQFIGLQPIHSFTRDAYGNVAFGNHLLHFSVTDNMGGTVYITLSFVSQQAVEITTLGIPHLIMPPRPPVLWEQMPVHEQPFAPPIYTIPSRVCESFTAPDLTVYEIANDMAREERGRIMAPEAAALYTAMYIWELFGKCLDGLAVEMRVIPSWGVGAAWQGVVLREPCQYLIRYGDRVQISRAPGDELFVFTIDAHTGKMISILRPVEFYACDTITSDELYNADFTKVHTMAPEKEFGQAIDRYVYVLTLGGQLVSLMYQRTEPAVIERDTNGNVIVAVHHIFFDAQYIPADSQPTTDVLRIVSLSIDADTGELVWGFVQPLHTSGSGSKW